VQRRQFVRGLLGSALWPATALADGAVAREPAFAHGVASGDPMSDRVILWTRVSGAGEQTVNCDWTLAADPALREVVTRGSFVTDASRDHTVKVDADGLQAGGTWYYRFELNTPDGRRVQSPIGRTRTLAVGHVASVRFAVASCANYPYGYFHAYRDIASQESLDAVLHLGDYIYEYGLGGYATERAEQLGRIPEPRHEALTLDDLRCRHAQYKTDPDLKALHAAHPVIAIWDDHELANDAWKGGAQNHGDDEGAWEMRRDAAIQAWLEWMPVRAGHERAETRIFRQFRFGDLATLVMLDTRVVGRDRQPDAPGTTADEVVAALRDPARRLLGERQEAWLREVLLEANTTWQLIGQQVMLAPTLSPSLGPLLDRDRPSMLSQEQLDHYVDLSRDNPPMLLDTWNGYPVARQQLLTDLARYARNPVVLSGDLHTSMAANLYEGEGDRPVAVELMTGSISSPGFAEYLPERNPGAVRDATLELNPSLVYMETDRRGWLQVELTHARCTASWRLLDTVHELDWSVVVDRRLQVEAGHIGDGLQPV
jgi:alkaline phosphatase D